MEIAANIGGVEDARAAVENGAEAVGLLRTEFLFLDRVKPPSEDEQFEVYQQIGQAMGERPVVVRTPWTSAGINPFPIFRWNRNSTHFLGIRGHPALS